MGFVEDLENKTKDYLEGNYEITELDYIPDVRNVAIGKKITKIKLCAFSIDMRNSSDLLFGRWKQTSAKIHKAFLTIVAETITHRGGKIRDFQGDSILAFWSGNYKSSINEAVKAAMNIKWLLSKKFKSHFEEYVELDFGIGIDWSEAYIVRAGLTDNRNNNDLVYIAPAVNFAVAIANQLSGKKIGISERVYSNLEEDHIFHKEKNMWEENQDVKWAGKSYDIYTSTYHWVM